VGARAWAGDRIGEDLTAQIDPDFTLGPHALTEVAVLLVSGSAAGWTSNVLMLSSARGAGGRAETNQARPRQDPRPPSQC
jgi:hypothetical protein